MFSSFHNFLNFENFNNLENIEKIQKYCKIFNFFENLTKKQFSKKYYQFQKFRYTFQCFQYDEKFFNIFEILKKFSIFLNAKVSINAKNESFKNFKISKVFSISIIS